MHSMKMIARNRDRVSKMIVFSGLLLVNTAVTDAGYIFDWEIETQSTPDFIVAVPTLNNSSGQVLKDFISARNAANLPVAVKVTGQLSQQAVTEFLDAYKIDYVFADYESAGSTLLTLQLTNQVRGSAASSQAHIGNYALDPLNPDFTGPNPNGGYTSAAYSFLSGKGLDVSNDTLYPGSPGFRNPAAGNSSAPNIRSALFTLPLTRFSLVDAALPSDDLHSPYVTRFNNWGNSSLDNSTLEGFDYVFETGNQLLSRGDFSALVSHYRLRGADDIILFQPGVVGYTKEQMQMDAFEGWSNNLFDIIYNNGSDPTSASLDTNISIRVGNQFANKSIEEAGVIWSGVFNNDLLGILVSNLDGIDHQIRLPSAIGGFDLDTRIFDVRAGSHRFIDFGLFNNIWSLFSADGQALFVDGNRAGIGIPEPASLVLAIMGGVLMVRRSRLRD